MTFLPRNKSWRAGDRIRFWNLRAPLYPAMLVSFECPRKSVNLLITLLGQFESSLGYTHKKILSVNIMSLDSWHSHLSRMRKRPGKTIFLSRFFHDFLNQNVLSIILACSSLSPRLNNNLFWIRPNFSSLWEGRSVCPWHRFFPSYWPERIYIWIELSACLTNWEYYTSKKRTQARLIPSLVLFFLELMQDSKIPIF